MFEVRHHLRFHYDIGLCLFKHKHIFFQAKIVSKSAVTNNWKGTLRVKLGENHQTWNKQSLNTPTKRL